MHSKPADNQISLCSNHICISSWIFETLTINLLYYANVIGSDWIAWDNYIQVNRFKYDKSLGHHHLFLFIQKLEIIRQSLTLLLSSFFRSCWNEPWFQAFTILFPWSCFNVSQDTAVTLFPCTVCRHRLHWFHLMICPSWDNICKKEKSLCFIIPTLQIFITEESQLV